MDRLFGLYKQINSQCALSVVECIAADDKEDKEVPIRTIIIVLSSVVGLFLLIRAAMWSWSNYKSRGGGGYAPVSTRKLAGKKRK